MHYGKCFHMEEDGGSKFLSLASTETGDLTDSIFFFFFRKKKRFFLQFGEFGALTVTEPDRKSAKLCSRVSHHNYKNDYLLTCTLTQ